MNGRLDLWHRLGTRLWDLLCDTTLLCDTLLCDSWSGCGPPKRGERVLLALTNRNIRSSRACRTATTSHLLGSGVGVAHARSALRAKRALAGGDQAYAL